MKGRILFIIAAFFFTFSCTHIQNKNKETVAGCNDNLSQIYFNDWESSVDCALKTLESPSADGLNRQIANFIIGEKSFLDYQEGKALDFFLKAVDGPENSLACASVSYIQRINPDLKSIEKIIDKNTEKVSGKQNRLQLDLKRLQWALAMDRKDVYKMIRKQIFVPAGFNVKRFSEDEKTSIKITPDMNGFVNIRNYFSDVDRKQFLLTSEFHLAEKADLFVLVQTGMKHEIMVDGFNVDRKNVFTLSKGNHRISVKIQPEKDKSSEIAVYMPFYNAAPQISDRTKENGSFAFIENELIDKTVFYKYIGLLSNQNAAADDYFKLYSFILGTFSPPFIYNLALRSLEERSVERGLSYLKEIINKKRLLRPELEILEWLLYSGRKNDVENYLKDFPLKNENIQAVLFKLDRLSFEKQYLAGLLLSRELMERYGDHPASYYYLAGAYEDLGNMSEALDVRLDLLEKIPYHTPLLTSIGEIAARLEKTGIEKMVLERKISLSPEDIGLLYKLASLNFRTGNYEQSENAYDRILSSLRNDLKALIGKGDVAFITGEREKAEKYYNRAFLLHPESDEASRKASFFKNTGYDEYFRRQSKSDDEINLMLSTEKDVKDMPAVVIFDEGHYKVVNHNLIVARFRLLIKVNTPEGVEDLRETRYSGDLLNAAIIRDGKKIRIQKKQDDLLDLSILKPGDVLDYSFQVITENDHWLKGFSDSWLFGSPGTIYIDSEVSVFIPDGMKFNYYISSGIKDPEITEEKDGKTYCFSKKNTALPPEEEDMPERLKVIPNLQFSVVNSWSDFAKWQAEFIKEGRIISKPVEEKTFSLIDKNDDLLTIVKKIRNFVAGSIQYRSIDPGELAVRPENSDVTLKRLSGDCKDKALLLKTMLEIAGIKSQYTLIRSKFAGSFVKQVPSMQFDHALVYIPEQKGIKTKGFFIDPTSGYDTFLGLNRALSGVEAMVIDEENSSFQFLKVDENIKGRAEFILNKEELSSADLTGTAASMFRFKTASGKSPLNILRGFFGEKDKVSSLIEDVDASKIDSDPLNLSFKSDIIFPEIVSTVYRNLITEKKRKYPFVTPYLSESYSFIIECEVARDVNFRLENRFFSYSAEKYAEGKVKVDFAIKKWTIDVEEFAELEKYVINVMTFEKKMKDGEDG